MASIFIIDDEETIRYLYQEGLTLEGHQIIGTAQNGMQAIENIGSMKSYPDVIILDHRMPIKNGIETLKELRKNKIASKSKILFVTADPTIREEASNLGISLFIQKPFSILKLAKLITNLFS